MRSSVRVRLTGPASPPKTPSFPSLCTACQACSARLRTLPLLQQAVRGCLAGAGLRAAGKRQRGRRGMAWASEHVQEAQPGAARARSTRRGTTLPTVQPLSPAKPLVPDLPDLTCLSELPSYPLAGSQGRAAGGSHIWRAGGGADGAAVGEDAAAAGVCGQLGHVQLRQQRYPFSCRCNGCRQQRRQAAAAAACEQE